MTQLKKDKAPLFYQLTFEEWVETVKDLTGAEIKVLYYLRSLDPFGDRELDYSVTQMALQLGLSKGAVSKALKKLDQLGLIDVELVRVKVRIKTNKSSITEFPKGNSVSYRKQELLIGNENLPEETEVSSGKQQLSIGNEQQPERLSDKDSRPCHTNNTYIDFLDSLSEGERENFLEFGKNKAAQLPRPPELPLKWIEANFEELAAQWRKTPSGAATNSKWENDPRHQEWLDKIRSLGFGTFIYESGKRDKEREEFFRWANANNLIWGAES